MAVKFLEPGGDADFGTNLWTVESGAPSIVTDFVHAGHVKSIKYAPATIDVLVAKTTTTDAAGRHHFWLYINALPSATATIGGIENFGVTPVYKLRLSSAGVLILAKSDNTQIATGSTLSIGRWYELTLAHKITSATVNELRLFLASTLDITVTNTTLVDTGSNAFFFGNSSTNATLDMRTSDHYMDDSNALTYPGNIMVTAKRPVSNGTAVEFTTQIGAGGSGYGTGHAPQVNERALSATNGWSLSTTTRKTEEYSIEGQAVGDIDISSGTIVDYMGWIRASVNSTANSPVHRIIVANVLTAKTMTTSAATYLQVAGSSTYPAGNTDIGMDGQFTTTPHLTSLFECGIVVAYIPPPTTKTITGLARITKTVLQTITGVARLTKTVAQTITGVSRITKTAQQTETGTARIQLVTTKTETGLARITKTVAQTITGVARLTVTTARTITGLARVQVSTSRTVTGLSRITVATARTITGLARITAATARTITGVSRIQVSTSRTETGVSRIQITTTRTITGVANIASSGVTTQQTVTGKARIQITTQQTVTGLARITVTTTRTITGKGRIQVSTTRTVTGLSRITVSTQRTLTGLSRITATTPRTETGVARIRVTTTKTESGVARITVTTTRTETGTARITVTTTKTVTGTSRITKTTTRTETGLSRIQVSTQRTVTGVARITKTVSRTITGVARVTITTLQTITGKSRITKAVQATETGVARVTATTSRNITGKGSISVTTVHDITGVARIIPDITLPDTEMLSLSGRANELPLYAGGDMTLGAAANALALIGVDASITLDSPDDVIILR